MTQQIRFLLFVAISVGLLYGWQALFAPQPQPESQAPVAAKTEKAPAPKPGAPAAPSAPDGDGFADGSPEAQGERAEPEPELKTVTVTNGELWRATFSSKGAAIESFELLGRKLATRPGKGDVKPFDLAHPDAQQLLPLSAQIDLPTGVVAADAMWEVQQEPTAVVFTRKQAGAVVTKRYVWKADSYELELDIAVVAPDLPARVPVKLTYAGWEEPEGSTGFMGMGGSRELHEAVCKTSKTLKRKGWDAKEVAAIEGVVGFAGIDEKYFIAAIAPKGDQQASCAIGGTRPGELEAVVVGAATPDNGKHLASFDLYLGPKDVDRLVAADHNLIESIDYGFFAIIARPLLALLKLFQSLVTNWGIAIILLTVLVKGATFPLTHKQMRSMEEMRRLAPKLEELKKKFAGDQQRVNMETMKLYKDHKVQPLAGCFPMLIQMPVWFALYTMLSNSFELYNEPFVAGWITDLTSKDPFYVLPILMTVTMVLTQILTPQPQQNQQMKMMMYGMPVFFGFIMISLPAGLVLYIFTNNVLSIGQSLWFRRKYGHPQVNPA